LLSAVILLLMKIILIDNYDSFTYNLLHYLYELGAEAEVLRNDAESVESVIKSRPGGIVISPGPCTPDAAGICLELIEKAKGKIPILGVCLGHQAIAQAFGGKIIRAKAPVHGKVSEIIVTDRSGIFKELPDRFKAARYHSLVADPKTFPAELEITAKTGDGTIMALSHKKYNIHGVQFHPESIASEHGHKILKNFLELCQK